MVFLGTGLPTPGGRRTEVTEGQLQIAWPRSTREARGRPLWRGRSWPRGGDPSLRCHHFSLYGEYVFLFVLSKIQSRVTQLLVFGSISQGAILVHFLSHSHFSLLCFIKTTEQGYAAFSLWFHFPRCHFGTFFKPQPFQSVRGIHFSLCFIKNTEQGYAAFSLWFHFPRCHFGTFF